MAAVVPWRQAASSEFHVQVGASIASSRGRAGLSQAALAQQIGVESSLMSHIEAGRLPKLPLFTTYQITSVLPVHSVDALLPGSALDHLLTRTKIHVLIQSFALLSPAMQDFILSTVHELAQTQGAHA